MPEPLLIQYGKFQKTKYGINLSQQKNTLFYGVMIKGVKMENNKIIELKSRRGLNQKVIGYFKSINNNTIELSSCNIGITTKFYHLQDWEIIKKGC